MEACKLLANHLVIDCTSSVIIIGDNNMGLLTNDHTATELKATFGQ